MLFEALRDIFSPSGNIPNFQIVQAIFFKVT